MKIIYFIILLSCFFACSKKKAEVRNETGNVVESFEVNKSDQKDGSYTGYYPSGKTKEQSTYKNGVLVGKRILFYENGETEIEEIYDDHGKLEGPYKVFYDSGKLKLEKSYKNNIVIGVIKVYYPSGGLKEEVSMSENLENGPFVEYYENGSVHWKGTYRDGDKEYGLLEEFDSTGVLLKKMMCDTMAICRTFWKQGMPELLTDTIK